jgi:hypothetical protein
MSVPFAFALDHPGVAMSAPTPTWRRSSANVTAITAGQPASRSALDVALAVTARLGTAVTLAALLVLTGTVLGHVGAVPTPAGGATSGR